MLHYEQSYNESTYKVIKLCNYNAFDFIIKKKKPRFHYLDALNQVNNVIRKKKSSQLN